MHVYLCSSTRWCKVNGRASNHRHVDFKDLREDSVQRQVADDLFLCVAESVLAADYL